jgi:neopullulanase
MKTYSRIAVTMLFCMVLFFNLNAQGYSIIRFEPPNWWAGMNNPELQLLVYGERIADLQPKIAVTFDGKRVWAKTQI